ncbi:MAG: phosphoribosylanthranilate isomerase [gamma proteobacterium symbiont of Lucinoma myriamae]|nr:phosphoribosylanthranilate isomerase [gamma proteobacterium symbiont of Lucinoma myriamae]MCU7819004.1 phosphoribosylanthranilate isomerase [gamma proteobacterium symbiont of Lucinoma myriamae]MCU7831784.1 phosphoribosylanthranilate isomerase [gamma proteobacterium symbiont of Lucinoma myriamae]
MSRVKICGITNSEDAKFACDSGADAIGLVFYPPSPRCVSIKKALEVVNSLPPFITSVALFVNAQRQEIERVLDEVAIDLIQFHGDETEEFCASFKRPYIKAVRMKEGLDLYKVQNDYASARGLLLDTYKKGIPGGTGEAFNWDKVPHDLSLPVILAGGLVPENITQAIQQVKPYAVDVSGGVEASKGKKDRKKIIRFMESVKCAD